MTKEELIYKYEIDNNLPPFLEVLKVRHLFGIAKVHNIKTYEWLVEPIYLFIDRFTGQCAKIVDQNKLTGFIDRNGVVVIPCEYEYAEQFVLGHAIVIKDNKFGIINSKNEVQFDGFIYEDIKNKPPEEIDGVTELHLGVLIATLPDKTTVELDLKTLIGDEEDA